MTRGFASAVNAPSSVCMEATDDSGLSITEPQADRSSHKTLMRASSWRNHIKTSAFATMG